MRIKCPDCGEPALLDDRYEFVSCEKCGLKVTYGEYLDRVIDKEREVSEEDLGFRAT